MVSQTDICNRALQTLGARPITDIGDGSKNAQQCAICYDSLRLAILEAHPWNFATVFASLASTAAPVNPAPAGSNLKNYFVYTLPSDFIRVVAVNPQGTSWLFDTQNYIKDQDYFLQNGTILTWVGPSLPLRYVRDFQNTGRMSPLFREALAMLMAANMAEAITQSNTKKQAAAQAYSAAIEEAKKSNAIQKPAQVAHVDSWIQVRN